MQELQRLCMLVHGYVRKHLISGKLVKKNIYINDLDELIIKYLIQWRFNDHTRACNHSVSISKNMKYLQCDGHSQFADRPRCRMLSNLYKMKSNTGVYELILQIKQLDGWDPSQIGILFGNHNNPDYRYYFYVQLGGKVLPNKCIVVKENELILLQYNTYSSILSLTVANNKSKKDENEKRSLKKYINNENTIAMTASWFIEHFSGQHSFFVVDSIMK